jgi:type I restriction enzyme S subunit
MELRPGYKQTEVGTIPEEWEVKPLGDVVEFLDGRRRPVKDSDRAKMRGDIPYYGASGVVDYVNAFLFDEDLILLGEDGENILSRNCRLAFSVSGKIWVNNHAHVLRPKPGMAINYLTEFLESLDFAQYNTGTAQPKLNKRVCSGIPVLRPPPPEQRAIARPLADVDALLGALTQLIAKKRNLKQATMQHLLTGQIRLPGFTGKWEVKRLGDVSAIKTGKKNNDDKVEDGQYPFFVRSQTVERINSYSFDGEAILVPGEGGIGSIFHYVNGRFDYHQRVYRISDFTAEVCGKFVFFCIVQTFNKQATRNSVKATVDSLRLPTFVEFEFLAPSADEQTAVVAVLSDMDAEISALEQRLAKTRALKQGMMQELLTGRTRLV